MPDLLERAASGRAKCRGCGRSIVKGDWRFGEALPNPYAEGEAMYWFHLTCGACMRPEKLLATLEASSESIPDRDWLLQAARAGAAHDKLPRLASAERSPSARARCRQCRHLIEKGDWRLSLQAFEEGRFSPIGFIHVSCAEAYFGTSEILDRILRLSPDLTASDSAELERGLRERVAAHAEPPEPGAEGELAKTSAGAPPSEDAGDAAPDSPRTRRSAS